MGIEPASLRTLLDTLADLQPVALCQPDRYAVQLRMPVGEPDVALAEAMARHRAATQQVPLGGELVRIELLTPEELDQEWRSFPESDQGRAALEVLRGPDSDPVAEADAALDAITDEVGAGRVLDRMVRRLGGGVVAARLQDEWTLPVDITFGAGDPQVPIAEPWSLSRLRLEQALPRLVEKARDILGRLEAGSRAEEVPRPARVERRASGR